MTPSVGTIADAWKRVGDDARVCIELIEGSCCDGIDKACPAAGAVEPGPVADDQCVVGHQIPHHALGANSACIEIDRAADREKQFTRIAPVDLSGGEYRGAAVGDRVIGA